MFEQFLQTKESILLLITVPLYVIIISFEIIWSAIARRNIYKTKDTLMNLYLTSVNMGLDILMRAFAFLILLYFFNHQLFHLQNSIIYWILLLVAEDFLYYWEHRIDHYVRFFWAMHVTHHSSEQFNLTTGFRSSALQPLYRFIYFIPIAWAGFSPADIMFMYALTQIYGILIHTQTVHRMGFLEYFMATPSHHRVHHASNEKYLDKNMGMIFIVWDKLFGTFEREDETTIIKYGLTINVETPYHPVRIITHEWIHLFEDIKEEKSWRNKFLYLVKRPGWKPIN